MPRHRTKEDFERDAKTIHGDKYIYHGDYVNAHTKVCITCKEHGDFWQTPNSHLNGNGCPICAITKSTNARTKSMENFIAEANSVHKGKYIYTDFNYINSNTKSKIICPIHGEFWQTPSKHIHGRGCPKCGVRSSHDKAMKTTEQFISEAKMIHGDKFIYDKTEYKGNKKKLVITCRIHGDFWQVPIYHLRGSGCPYCHRSILEEDMANLLNQHKIKYNSQYTFDELFVNEHNTQHLDFYLPEYNIAIECQGVQHFKPTDFGGKGNDWAKQQFEHVKELDERKKRICESKGIKILYFAKEKYNDDIIIDTNILIEKILEHDKLRTDAT